VRKLLLKQSNSEPDAVGEAQFRLSDMHASLLFVPIYVLYQT
jgi:hypothetical protein